MDSFLNMFTSMIHLHDVVVTRESLMSTDLDGDTVLLDTESGHYFGLNGVGARVWELAREPRAVRDILDELLTEYDVPEVQLKDDVLSFVNGLAQHSLLFVVQDANV